MGFGVFTMIPMWGSIHHGLVNLACKKLGLNGKEGGKQIGGCLGEVDPCRWLVHR